MMGKGRINERKEGNEDDRHRRIIPIGSGRNFIEVFCMKLIGSGRR